MDPAELNDKIDTLQRDMDGLSKSTADVKDLTDEVQAIALDSGKKLDTIYSGVAAQEAILRRLQDDSHDNTAKMDYAVEETKKQNQLLDEYVAKLCICNSRGTCLKGRLAADGGTVGLTEPIRKVHSSDAVQSASKRETRQTRRSIAATKNDEYSKLVLRNCEDGLKKITCPVKGRGVAADKAFSKHDFVVEYRGDFIDQSTANRREKKYVEDGDAGCFVYHFQFNGRRYCIDATAETPHLGRLVNHSVKRPNLVPKAIDVKGTPHLILVARQSISVGEELLYDYGDRSASARAAYPWLKNS